MKMLQKQIVATLGLSCVLVGESASAADSGGPIEYPGMNVQVDSHGVQSLSYNFSNDCQKPEPWRAKWIWLDGEKNAAAAMFRKEIVLQNAPRSAKAWLTADARYRLFINGRLVSRGPVDMGRDYAGGNTHRWFYDFRELQSYLMPGTNVIAAEVFRNWIGWTVSRGKPGFLFESEIVDEQGNTSRVASDETNDGKSMAPSHSSIDLRPLRNPVWVSKDNLRDPSVVKTPEGYHLFYSRFSGQTASWGDPANWHTVEFGSPKEVRSADTAPTRIIRVVCGKFSKLGVMVATR